MPAECNPTWLPFELSPPLLSPLPGLNWGWGRRLPAMTHSQNKHYPLWPSWLSAAWVNGTSSCFWAPPDKLTL